MRRAAPLAAGGSLRTRDSPGPSIGEPIRRPVGAVSAGPAPSLTSERASPQIPNAASVTQRQDEKNVIDKHFQEEVRDQLKPGMSALFLVVENVTPDKALAALSKFGGTVMRIPDRRCEHGGDGDNLETGGPGCVDGQRVRDNKPLEGACRQSLNWFAGRRG